MKSFQWDENFETGLADVDHQHQQLVDIINEFGYLITENKLELKSLEQLFFKLADYAKYHFKEEEELMKSVGVDQRHTMEHIKIHHGFLHEVMLLYKNISKDNLSYAKNLLDYLTHWLAFHILGQDQNMARQIQAIQSGMDPKTAFDTEEREKDKTTKPLLVALNGLFDQVSARNKELITLNQTLENKVIQRTKELSDANHRLEELSLTDALTGLPNRRYAMKTLTALWHESTTNDTPLICMMIDADHFKQVNDKLGHDAGDKVLRELSTALQHSVRSDDIVCRLGGDEFFVICPNTDLKGGLYTAGLILQAVSELKITLGDGIWESSISIGVAARSTEMKTHEDLIRTADLGLYAAKHNGRNCIETIS